MLANSCTWFVEDFVVLDNLKFVEDFVVFVLNNLRFVEDVLAAPKWIISSLFRAYDLNLFEDMMDLYLIV